MILLDSSLIVSYAVESDINHVKASKIMDEILKGRYGKILITDYIFDECMTVTFVRSKSLDKAISLGNSIKSSTKILKIDEKSFNEGWEVFKKQKGTNFSFTDCTTISIMQSENIRNIATFDKDFQKIKEINLVNS